MITIRDVYDHAQTKLNKPIYAYNEQDMLAVILYTIDHGRDPENIERLKEMIKELEEEISDYEYEVSDLKNTIRDLEEV